MKKRIKTCTLSSGTLRLFIDSEKVPLDTVSCFAGRRNNRRGFLFVSKVLGKHYPAMPSAMREISRRLALETAAVTGTEFPGSITALAMAETATGLGREL